MSYMRIQTTVLETSMLIGIALTTPLFMAVGLMFLIPIGLVVDYIIDPVERLLACTHVLQQFVNFVFFSLSLPNDIW